MIRLAPSILSADFSRIGDAVRMAEDAGADMIHLDIMDGHFVPNLTLGPQAVASIKKTTQLPIDVHLMVEKPGFFIPLFHEAGADWISIHVEASTHLHRDISLIKELGRKAGIALNPATPIHLLNDILKDLDYILIMSVNPGFGGQKFIDSTHQRIRQLRSWISGQNLSIPIEVDGGINPANAENLIRDGAEILVVGASIFAAEDPVRVISRLKEIMAKENRP
ncbi:MAG: ribulose-phosphate 3-epimerase [Candidatus Aminicenantes bacterium RBG_19FT_COMBO_58_17]|jgi:ribulose-phosphate 3-epimerase|nr:MAG: ribulose-phosphate 3-epimerase [Candidatus Aminicenantes bacterium RBG_19FT_COMBO_58_17]HCS47132.1 ribulose-phosphate 3-epimerase [Candidatus Aminicenantes bacterium]